MPNSILFSRSLVQQDKSDARTDNKNICQSGVSSAFGHSAYPRSMGSSLGWDDTTERGVSSIASEEAHNCVL
jgi:hypothetical protein